MIRLQLRIRWKHGIAGGLALALALLVMLGLAIRSRPIAAEAPQSGEAAAGEARALRSFYQTDANYDTDEVLTACAEGYHMASLWEILEVSNLSYAYDHADAFTRADSGQGPPSNWYGWVRTGGVQSSSATAGKANCLGWTSTDGAHNGSAVRLSGDWETASTAISPWEANAVSCRFRGPVWCVQDVVPDLRLTKTVTPSMGRPGQAVTYTLRYNNSGLGWAKGVVLTDVVPAAISDVQYISSGAPITQTGSVDYVWEVADLTPGSGGIITITGVVSPSLSMNMTIVNSAAIASNGADYNLDDNSDDAALSATVIRLYLPVFVRR